MLGSARSLHVASGISMAHRRGLSCTLLVSAAAAAVFLPRGAAAVARDMSAHAAEASSATIRNVYLTLVSSPEWLLAARTLAQSLTLAGCKWPRVLLTTFVPSDRLREELASELWDVRVVPKLVNPFDASLKAQHRFSMLQVYNLTEFSKIVFLDSDFLVVSNLDHVFDCGEWCAARSLRETEGRFNSGLQVLTPSADLFRFLLEGTKPGPGGFQSYNGGPQGFLNEAISAWCSHGKVRRWSQVRSASVARRCQTLPEGYNHLPVVLEGPAWAPVSWWPPSRSLDEFFYGMERENNRLVALHFNSPVYNVVKPWLWYWYPLFPSHWLWWQVRRQVPGEDAAALRLFCAGVVCPVLLSIWFVWRRPRCLIGAIDGAWAPRALRACQVQYCQRRHVWRVPFFSTLASALVIAVIPSHADALVAWASYFACKGCMLGFLSFGTTRTGTGQHGSDSPLGRLRWVLFGYVCTLLECLVIWLPQCRGAHWVSDTLFAPFCSRYSQRAAAVWLALALGCKITAWIVIVICALIILFLHSLVFQYAWYSHQVNGRDPVAVYDFIDVSEKHE